MPRDDAKPGYAKGFIAGRAAAGTNLYVTWNLGGGAWDHAVYDVGKVDEPTNTALLTRAAPGFSPEAFRLVEAVGIE